MAARGLLTARSAYCELHAHSSFSLLDGVPSPEDLIDAAVERGLGAIALTDHDNLYGVVPFAQQAERRGVQAIIGCELTLDDGAHLTLLAENDQGYRHLCQLITAGRAGKPKGESAVAWEMLAERSDGLICLTGCRQGPVAARLLMGDRKGARTALERLTAVFGKGNLVVELQRHERRGDTRLTQALALMAGEAGLPIVATGNVHYLTAEDADLQQVLASNRQRRPLAEAELYPNYRRMLRSTQDMYELFYDLPQAVAATGEIAARCHVTLPRGLQVLPTYPTPQGEPADVYLRQLCAAALPERFARRMAEASALLDKELAVVVQLGMANYFLIVWDIIAFCKRSRILAHGRGSAANSLIAYLLGITAVDPLVQGLVFERFLSVEKGGTPDIDIDIDAARREEVIQYVYARYGRDHAAMASTYVTYRHRSALRDVAFSLGASQETATALVKAADIGDALPAEWQRAEALAERLLRKPRHLGIHNGGMVITGDPIASRIPIEPASMAGRTVTQFDKESLESLGIVKIDLLGLRMLSAISDCVALVRRERGITVDLHALDFADRAVYDQICSAQTIGMFQVESGAQVSIIPHLQPRRFDDLVVEVSLIRPGPLQGNMVRPYIERRQGNAPVSYPHPALQPALSDTLGVIVFQEQVIKIARDAAGFSPGQGELLRKALGSKHAEEAIAHYYDAFAAGAAAQGIDAVTAANIWEMIRGFAGYSFSKAHAAAFAVIVYWSAWLRVKYPTEYFCGLLRNAPLGTYPARALEAEARRVGICFLPININRSQVKPTVRRGRIRHGLGYVKGLSEEQAKAIVKARGKVPFASLADVVRRTGFKRPQMVMLMKAGALDGFGERHQVEADLAAALHDGKGPPRLALAFTDEALTMKPLSVDEKTLMTFAATGVTVDRHLADLKERDFAAAHCWAFDQIKVAPIGRVVRAGGIVADGVRRPPTAKGTAFLRLETRHGIIDVIVPATLLADKEVQRALRSAFLVIDGRVKAQNGITSMVALRLRAL